MTTGKVSTYYKWASLVTLALSIVGPFLLVDGSIGEKLWIGLLMNGQFHLSFQFISRVLFATFQQIPPENVGQRKKTRLAFTAASLFLMIAPIWPLTELVKSAIRDHHYDQLMVVMTFVGIFLGAYSLNRKLKEA